MEFADITANALIVQLDRNNIFPPLLNDPAKIISNKSRQLKKRTRTPNSFLVCRMNVQSEVTRKNLNVNMRIISKAAGILWKNAYPDEKNVYKQLADTVKEHFESTSLTSLNCLNSIKNSYEPYHSFRLMQSLKPKQVANDVNLQYHSNSEVENIVNSQYHSNSEVAIDLLNNYNLFNDIQLFNFYN